MYLFDIGKIVFFNKNGIFEFIGDKIIRGKKWVSMLISFYVGVLISV